LWGYEVMQVLPSSRCAWEVPFEEQLLDAINPGSNQNQILSVVNVKPSGPGRLAYCILEGWTSQPWVLDSLHHWPLSISFVHWFLNRGLDFSRPGSFVLLTHFWAGSWDHFGSTAKLFHRVGGQDISTIHTPLGFLMICETDFSYSESLCGVVGGVLSQRRQPGLGCVI
jgi:hypothetical protein